MTTPKHTDSFLAYCREFAYNKKRETPLHSRTLSRYHRGLKLVEKIVGHDLESVSDTDQLIFMEGIMKYEQGTRRVSTQIFQRYVAWGKKNGIFDCDNLLRGKEQTIIGEYIPPRYTYISKKTVKNFFMKLKTPQLRMVFAIMYYGGLTVPELAALTRNHLLKDGLLVYREVRKESQLIPLPSLMLVELRQYAETREDLLFDIGSEASSRFRVNEWYRAAQVESGEILGTTVRDFRTSGIRHYFELSQSLEHTKAFAGVPDDKKGWLEGLVDVSSYYMKNIAKARSYHGSAEKQLESG